MKKTLRFAALAAALSLTSVGTPAARAISPPCYFKHGLYCSMSGPGMSSCGTDGGGVCICNDGHWDCGCIYDDVGSLMCPGD